MIARYEVANYKSIRDIDLRMGALTVIIGANGTGKSNLMDSFGFLADAVISGLVSAIDRRGGLDMIRRRTPKRPPDVRFAVVVPGGEVMGFRDMRYSFVLAPHRGDFRVKEESFEAAIPRPRVRRRNLSTAAANSDYDTIRFRVRDGDIVEGKEVTPPVMRESESVDPHDLLLRSLLPFRPFRGIRAYFGSFRLFSIEPHFLRELQEYSAERELAVDGRNLGCTIGRLHEEAPELYQGIVELLRAAVPFVEEVSSHPVLGKVSLEFHESDPPYDFPAAAMSDGTLRLLGLLTAVCTARAGSLIAFEEPEKTVHPAAVALLADVFREAAKRTQVVITTHDPDLLDHVRPEEVVVMLRRNGSTVVERLSKETRKVLQEDLFSLGEYWRAGGLGDRQLAFDFAED